MDVTTEVEGLSKGLTINTNIFIAPIFGIIWYLRYGILSDDQIFLANILLIWM